MASQAHSSETSFWFSELKISESELFKTLSAYQIYGYEVLDDSGQKDQVRKSESSF